MFNKLNRGIVTIFAAGALFGILFWGGFHTVIEATNTLEFCTSCHEMDQVFEEYQQSSHYKNAAGVRTICSDCHVPKPWGPKIVRKVLATNDLYHKILGTIDTPQKFEAKRLELAERVWARLRANDSRECRSCHAFAFMDFHKQDRRAARKMKKVVDKNTGETCIDCHKGIAHKLPQGYDDEEDEDD